MTEEVRGFRPSDYMNMIGKIPVFNGSRNCKEAEAWMKVVKSYKGFFKIGFNDGMFLTAIVSSFRDRAQAWWENVEDSVETWGEFDSRFNNKFLKANTDEAWTKLRSIKQGQHQDVEQFTSEINGLFKAAGITDDGMKISLFISAINVNIAYELEML
ncbi:hypothetical protein INT47_010630 [Mucor saturninus]|uniref:Retrotransposon gag domain-containing protein n=1 Tax=Mucor saturninus TaxID=64648 RepID=A0A8H7UN37_9FUNG|nr:hypothetical protein INT47_010630 [Mucor saturninus]